MIRNEEGVIHTYPKWRHRSFCFFLQKIIFATRNTHFDTDFKKEIEDRFKLLIDECKADHGYLPGDKITLTEKNHRNYFSKAT